MPNNLNNSSDEYHYKSIPASKTNSIPSAFSFATDKEVTSEYWLEKGQSILSELLNRKLNNNNAKNVIMFLGDGMSLPTVAATRVYIGGEEKELSFEKFPHSGFSKVIWKIISDYPLHYVPLIFKDLLCRRSSS